MNKMIRLPRVAEKLCVGKSTVWLYAREGKIPKPTKLSPRVSVWLESDIDAFIAERVGA